jgi:NIPSNAP
MTKRVALKGSSIAVSAVMGMVIGIAAASGFFATRGVEAAQQGGAAQQAGRGQGAPAEPPSPCGPKAALPENLSRNVAPSSRCFEIRMYTADPSRDGVGQFKGGINELHQRFREQEVALFVKHGAEILGVWQHLGDSNTLVWMLAYRDRAHREEVWAAFGKDPEWDALRKKYFVPLKTNTFLMSASDYSPMK